MAGPVRLYRHSGKRLFDLVAASIALLVLTPLVVLLMAIAMSDGGSALFRHKRVGRGGRVFECLKIRSMAPDAAERLVVLLSTDVAAREEWLTTRKLQNDPRVTRFGRFLRKTSLDELPQLWNVVRGDMSLVGPRPVVQEELARYGRLASAYRMVRPGLTGAWQVSGRNEVSYDQRVALDADYVKNYSFLRDMGILLRTPFCILHTTGW